MNDPLTAATLNLDQIVEMCDEMIAAHGDLLPNMDAKKTLSSTSGKSFAVVDPKILRKSWSDTQANVVPEHIRAYRVIGPFKGEAPGKISLDLKTPVEDDFLNRADGSVDLKAAYSAGGKSIKWEPATTNRKGYLNLVTAVGAAEWAVAYAYVEIESIHPRETVMKVGSKDGIRLWLNGKMVYNHDVKRDFFFGTDEVPVHLKEGINRLLVKIDNHTGGWGFSIVIPKPNF
jgi:hypothetical protein